MKHLKDKSHIIWESLLNFLPNSLLYGQVIKHTIIWIYHYYYDYNYYYFRGLLCGGLRNMILIC